MTTLTVDYPRVYFKLLWLFMAFSSIVFVEPSPHDVMFILILAGGLLFSHFAFPDDLLVPSVFLWIFILSNLVSLLMVTGIAGQAIRYVSISFYLISVWLVLAGVLGKYGEKAARVILQGYLAAAVMAAIAGVGAYLGWIPGGELLLEFGRVTGFFKDPNVFGPFLIPAALFALHMAQGKNGAARFCYTAAFLLLTIGVLLSFSRAAWGNYLLSMAIYYFLPSHLPLKKKFLAVFIFLCVMLPALYILLRFSAAGELFGQRLGLQHYDSQRFATQLASLKATADYPLGIGPGQSETFFSYSTHSLYARIAAENGMMGMLSFLAFLMVCMYQSLRLSLVKGSNVIPYASVITATLAGLLFNSFFIDTLHWRHFWLLLALSWIPPGKGEEEHESGTDYYPVG